MRGNEMGIWGYVLGAGVVVGIIFAVRQALHGQTSAAAGCDGDCEHCAMKEAHGK